MNRLFPIVILLALVGGLLWWLPQQSSCSNASVSDVAQTGMNAAGNATEAVGDAAKTGLDAAGDAANVVKSTLGEALGALFSKKLPNGTELKIPEMGVENQLLQFVESTKPVDKTTWFNLDRILFETGKAALQPASSEQMSNLAAILKAYPTLVLKVGGYTDNTGDVALNKKLSQERAEAVKAALVKEGIPAERLDAEGYGPEHPVASNDTEEGKAQNRRIALRVKQK